MSFIALSPLTMILTLSQHWIFSNRHFYCTDCERMFSCAAALEVVRPSSLPLFLVNDLSSISTNQRLTEAVGAGMYDKKDGKKNSPVPVKRKLDVNFASFLLTMTMMRRRVSIECRLGSLSVLSWCVFSDPCRALL